MRAVTLQPRSTLRTSNDAGQTAPWKMGEFRLERVNGASLVEQISRHVEVAIVAGALPPGGRLPSWRDLAAQLGVARGTVREAYERLIDKGLLFTAGSAGTRVVNPLPTQIAPRASAANSLLAQEPQPRADRALGFQMGTPAHDAFPVLLWSRLQRQAVQATAAWTGHADACGLLELRTALASHLAIARGVECSPEQIIVTTGFRGGLALALSAIGATGKQAWVEDPGYPVTRQVLELSGLQSIAVPVDGEGLDVACGRALAPHAALAVVTPGQQAPSGVTLAPQRRVELLQWARQSDAWIIEDDYLAELQLSGRSANALAAGAGAERVIHVGTFSKTLGPMLRIGFVVAPPALARRLREVAHCLGATPNAALQVALTRFLREGHYLRHLRRMRRLYAERRQSLLETLAHLGLDARPAGLSVLLRLPDEVDDLSLAAAARAVGLAPSPLSSWSVAGLPRPGLLLGIANVTDSNVAQDCRRLLALIAAEPQWQTRTPSLTSDTLHRLL